MRKPLLVALATVVAIVACGKNEPAAPTVSQPPANQTMPMNPGSMPMGHPQVSAGIDYQLPAGWNRVQPASSMRMDQATIPGAGGQGEMAVFFFGPGQGGSVSSNLDRWVGQMEGASKPVRETFDANGLHITWIDVSGTLKPSSMGMGPTTPQPNSRMLAAVVEGEGGPWFFKATGPEATMQQARDGFVAMLRSMQHK